MAGFRYVILRSDGGARLRHSVAASHGVSRQPSITAPPRCNVACGHGCNCRISDESPRHKLVICNRPDLDTDPLHGARAPLPEPPARSKRKLITCIYHNTALRGSVRATLLRGKVVFLAQIK